jgi:hypothetical protein
MVNLYEVETLHALRLAEARRRGARAALLGEAAAAPRPSPRERAAGRLVALAARLRPRRGLRPVASGAPRP